EGARRRQHQGQRDPRRRRDGEDRGDAEGLAARVLLPPRHAQPRSRGAFPEAGLHERQPPRGRHRRVVQGRRPQRPALLMTMRTLAAILAIAACGAACGGGDDSSPMPDAPDAPPVPVANPARGISETKLAFDVTALSGTATITFEPSTDPGATLEVG